MLTRSRTLLSKAHPAWWFVIGFVLMCCAYEYGRVLHLRPLPHHLMRQTMSLSLTYNCYDGTGSLFGPVIHNYFNDDGTSGKSAAEFPLLYWIIGLVWRVTGPSEFVYRTIMLGLHFTGSLALFSSVRRLIGDWKWAVMLSLLFFTSPAIIYFAIGFITEVPAYDLVLIGGYMLVRHWPEQRLSDVAWASVLFAVAGMLKVSSFMGPLAAMACLACETVWPRMFAAGQRFFPHVRATWSYFGVSVALVLAWHLYAAHYNHLHGVSYSHQGILPIWDLTPERRAEITEFATSILVFELFDTTVWLALAGMLIYLSLNVRKVPRMAIVLNGALLLGAVGYTLLWYEPLEAHDYYFINPMIALVVLMTTFLWALRKFSPRVWSSMAARTLFLALLCYNVVYAANDMWMRTRGRSTLTADKVLPIHHGKQLWYWDLSQYWGMERVLDVEPYLRSIGVHEDDLVICGHDDTMCAMLYLCGQRGWNEFWEPLVDTAQVDRLIARGARYLIVKDDELTSQSFMQPYLQARIGERDGVRIFDLRKLGQGASKGAPAR